MSRSLITPEWLKAFARNYLAHGRNATKAYIDLHPDTSWNNARTKASQLLKRPVVKEAIRVATEELCAKFDTTTERLILEAARIAFLDPAALLDDDGNVRDLRSMSEDARRAIAGMDVEGKTTGDGEVAITKKIKISDKLRALEFIAKLQGQMVEKKQITGNISLVELLDEDLKPKQEEQDIFA